MLASYYYLFHKLHGHHPCKEQVLAFDAAHPNLQRWTLMDLSSDIRRRDGCV